MNKLVSVLLVQAGFSLGLIGQNPVVSFTCKPVLLTEKGVSPLIYGNFIELGLGRQIEGLWSEKLYNASFEEVVPLKRYMFDWLGKTPEDTLSHEKWWHSGYEVNDWYVHPSNEWVMPASNRYWNFHHGLQAAILQNDQPARRAFLAQDGVWINKSVKLLFRGSFSNGITADTRLQPVAVTIGLYPEKQFDNPLVERTITIPDGIYREFSVELDPGSYSGRTTFAISISPGTRVAADGFSLMPLNAMNGWRPEVIGALKRIHVPMIRFPGGCFASFYDWREGVGPRLDRQPVVSEYWGGIEENHAGTVEFIELCRLIESVPFLCVNMLTGTADRAADWVAYCNANAETRMGALRKQHGYPEPLGVLYWELDNETYRRFGWEEYARRCVEFSEAMKKVDPDIKLVMVGYWKFNDNLRDMLNIAGKYIDVITDRATSEADLNRDLDILREYNQQNGTAITLSNTEWLAPLDWSKSTIDALNFQKSPDQMTLQEHEISWNYAMNTARQLLLFQRLGGDFEFASFNNLANTWGQNIIECAKDTVFISAVGKVFELMSRSRLRWVLKTDTLKNLPGVIIQAGTSQIPNNKSQKTNSKSQKTNKLQTSNPKPQTSKPDTRNPKPDTLILYVLNYRSDTPEIRLDLSEMEIIPKLADVRSVNGAGPLSANTVGNQNQIFTSEEKIRIKNPGKPTFLVRPWSVTEITLIQN